MARSLRSLSSHRTFRWNDGSDVERYDAVETTDAGLLWYWWSHRTDHGGRRDAALQSFDAFVREGPLRAAPEPVLRALRIHLDLHGLIAARDAEPR
jgi:hypothetical protein